MRQMDIKPGIDWNWVKEELLRSEKIPSGKHSESTGRIMDCLKACIDKARPLAKPAFLTIEKTVVKNSSGSIELEGGVILSTRYISSCLKDAPLMNVFLATIGKDTETEASRLMKDGEELSGYLLDRIGSLAVESLAENIEEKLRKRYASKGLGVSTRFSPGYCDWKIEEQFRLAVIADFSSIGIALTKDCVMVPRKSISAIVGVGPKELFSKRQPQCVMCQKKDCNYRRDLKRS